mgnify:FL=1
MTTDDKTLPSSVRPAEPFSLEKALARLQATADLAVEYGQSANERLGRLEQRFARIERHLGLNGSGREGDTEPAPATEPENARPGEG